MQLQLKHVLQLQKSSNVMQPKYSILWTTIGKTKWLYKIYNFFLKQLFKAI